MCDFRKIAVRRFGNLYEEVKKAKPWWCVIHQGRKLLFLDRTISKDITGSTGNCLPFLHVPTISLGAPHKVGLGESRPGCLP